MTFYIRNYLNPEKFVTNWRFLTPLNGEYHVFNVEIFTNHYIVLQRFNFILYSFSDHKRIQHGITEHNAKYNIIKLQRMKWLASSPSLGARCGIWTFNPSSELSAISNITKVRQKYAFVNRKFHKGCIFIC